MQVSNRTGPGVPRNERPLLESQKQHGTPVCILEPIETNTYQM